MRKRQFIVHMIRSASSAGDMAAAASAQESSSPERGGPLGESHSASATPSGVPLEGKGFKGWRGFVESHSANVTPSGVPVQGKTSRSGAATRSLIPSSHRSPRGAAAATA